VRCGEDVGKLEIIDGRHGYVAKPVALMPRQKSGALIVILAVNKGHGYAVSHATVAIPM